MQVGQFCKREVVAVAQLMRERHIGFIVVYELGDLVRKSIGVLTDRDIVLGVTAKDIDPHSVTARSTLAADGGTS